MRASGLAATLLAGYQTAAAFGAWEMIPDGGRVIFSAAIIAQHSVWLQRTPLTLVVDVGRATWTWLDVAPMIADGRVTVALTSLPIVSDRRVDQ